MPKCKYCGFDPEDDSLYAVGAPCGYKGCLVFTCCHEAWKDHMMEAHGIDVDKGDIDDDNMEVV